MNLFTLRSTSSTSGCASEWEKYIRPDFEIHATPIRPERIVADCRAALSDDAIIPLASGIHHDWFMQDIKEGRAGARRFSARSVR